MERAIGIEPTTDSLEGYRSATELRPRVFSTSGLAGTRAVHVVEVPGGLLFSKIPSDGFEFLGSPLVEEQGFVHKLPREKGLAVDDGPDGRPCAEHPEPPTMRATWPGIFPHVDVVVSSMLGGQAIFAEHAGQHALLTPEW